jgi:hypothetical protein
MCIFCVEHDAATDDGNHKINLLSKYNVATALPYFFIQPDSGHFEASTILMYFSYESWPIVLVTKIPDCAVQTRYCYSIREDLVTTRAPAMVRATC